jgi:hypothetical protein
MQAGFKAGQVQVAGRYSDYSNVACCESLAGRTVDAVVHLGRAIEMWDGCRELAERDTDFDPIRAEPAFHALLAR